ncbi:MAG: transcriptional repressor NrdR [Mogibacterium sp.]|nr:transcriptional repressor NrdR [Mogibacterium sp.]
MKCPYCNNPDTKVVDSRPVEEGLAIRRRRECEKCKKRFTTFEKIENSLLVVVKNDGTRESFDRNKLINGVLKACEKTRVTYEDVQNIADKIERGLNNTMEKEIESKMIGGLIMEELRELDQVAYVRFASVYHKFTDVNTFVQEINKLLEIDRARAATTKPTARKKLEEEETE